MSNGRQQRVMDGREKFLLTTESIGKDFDVTADAILHAAFEVMLDVLGDRALAADLFWYAADSIERFGPIDRVEGVQ